MRQNSPNQAPRRKLIPNLFSSILKVIAESDRPLTQHEIVEVLSERLDRSDEELKRQITVNLHDALIYGYLRVRDYRYSIVPSRLDPNEPRTPSTLSYSSQHDVSSMDSHHHHHHQTADTKQERATGKQQATTEAGARQSERH